MSEGLWHWDELIRAAGGRGEGTPARAITGFSLDSRTVQPGEVFVAIRDVRDGHDFVPAALAAGAAAAVVSENFAAPSGAGALLRVADPLAALSAIGRAARVRTHARILAVTGSVGKTGTKEMLRACLSRLGKTHAAERSFNNQWGVPLTLADMPPDSDYGVFEIGMNHTGEITPLTVLVCPHVALITAVEPVHLAHFRSLVDIARAKAEIFTGLIPGGAAILPRDSAHYELLREHANAVGASIASFGYQQGADVRALRVDTGANGSDVIAQHGSERICYRLGVPGEHYVGNSLAVIAALDALNVDRARALPALAALAAPPGRGRRTLLDADGPMLLIDESYNANPASMRAALSALAVTPRASFPRRIAVLGDMLELGPTAPELHRALKPAIEAAGVDLVLGCGPLMRFLYDELATGRGGWAKTSQELIPLLLSSARAGDAIMIKGSLGTRMAPIVEAMLARFAARQAGGE